jgi:hypothetical protein
MSGKATNKGVMRGFPWLFLALVNIGVVYFLAPQQLGVLAWQLSKVSVGAYMGYWVDRSMFPNARPIEMEDGSQTDNARLRRAIMVASFVLAMGLGV